ncbi:trafficking protein particle complex subunit 12, partial [Phenoliferia sp. Uapishka_3]
MYVPGLTSPTLFVMLPMVDSVTTLVEKYFAPPDRPLRDLTGEAWKHQPAESLDSLIKRGSWHSVATYAREAILNASPTQTNFILTHWLLRLHSLLRLHLPRLFATELSSLFALLPPLLLHPIVPFDLYVLRASIPDLVRRDREGSVEMLVEVLKAAKAEMWRAGREGREEDRERWRERAEKVGMVIIGILGEMKAFPSSSNLLSPPSPSPILSTLLSKLHLSTGDLASFARSSDLLALTSPKEDKRMRALEKVARGDWKAAEAEWRELVREDETDLKVSHVNTIIWRKETDVWLKAINNLAVVLLFSEKLDEAIALLQTLVLPSPTSTAPIEEPIIFNLATLKELRTDMAMAEKVALLRTVVERDGGEALRGSCFKLVV